MGSTPIGISASRGAAILGQSKYSEPVEAWLKICEDRQPGFCELNFWPKPEFVDNAATRWGNALEDMICEFAVKEVESAFDIRDREKLSVHPEHNFITCHQDGEYYFSTTPHARVIHEGKTANERTFRNDWGPPGTDRIPRTYMIQVQHQMMLTGADECIVSVLVLPKMQNELPPPDDADKVRRISVGLYDMGYFHQYPVKANREVQKYMLEEYVKFWNNHVIPKVPPKPQSLDWVKKLIPKPCGTVIANEQIQRWSTELDGIKREIKQAKERGDSLKQLILDYMREQAALEDCVIDKGTTDKLVMFAPNGRKMHSYNGKQFR
jgi:predicted phage-related endonuclease